MPVETRTGGLQILAEAQHHCALLCIDAVDAAADPHRDDQDEHAAQAPAEIGGTLAAAPRTRAAAAEQRREPALDIAQHVVQIVLRLLRAVPGVAFLSAGFVPSHA